MGRHKKSIEEMDEDEREFYRLQALMLKETTPEGRAKYAWQMYPIIKSAMESAVKQRANNHFIDDFEDVVEDLVVGLIERFILRPREYKYFKTVVYYKSLDYYLPKYRNDNLSLDEFIESHGDSLLYIDRGENGILKFEQYDE